jgi:hypothetical protein
MSIILAIKSSRTAVVAADSQRVSSAGISEAPYDKTFRIGSLIGAHAGLLEFSGVDVKHHISDALGGKRLKPPDAVRAIGQHLIPILQALADTEVAFEHRRLEIIVASKAQLAAVWLRPKAGLREIELQYYENPVWLAAGYDQAKAEAERLLARVGKAPPHNVDKLLDLARSVVAAAIAAGAPHPIHKQVASCCLPVKLLHLR